MRVTILERGPGSYRLRIETRDDAGRRVFAYETVKGTKATAEARKAELLKQEDSAPGSAAGAKVLTKDYLEAWVRRRESTKDVSAATAHWYRLMLAYLNPYIGDTPIGKLTPRMIEDAYVKLMETKGSHGKTLNPRSVGHIHARLVTAFNDAAAEGWVKPDLMQRVKKPKVEQHFKEQVLGQADMQRLMRKVEMNQALGPVVRFALATGCRRGEICALKWEDIDFDEGTVTIRRNLVRVGSKPVEKTPKSKAGRRTISLPEDMLFELKLMHEFRISEYVFCTRDGRRRDPSALSQSIGELLDDAGLGQFTLHDLRHAHATSLLSRKMPVKAVSARLGHADVTTTLRTYTHVLPQDDAALAAEMNSIMSLGRK